VPTLRYIGPHDEVVVMLADGSESEPVARGGLFSTSAEHAKALLQQKTNWEAVKASAKKDGER